MDSLSSFFISAKTQVEISKDLPEGVTQTMAEGHFHPTRLRDRYVAATGPEATGHGRLQRSSFAAQCSQAVIAKRIGYTSFWTLRSQEIATNKVAEYTGPNSLAPENIRDKVVESPTRYPYKLQAKDLRTGFRTLVSLYPENKHRVKYLRAKSAFKGKGVSCKLPHSVDPNEAAFDLRPPSTKSGALLSSPRQRKADVGKCGFPSLWQPSKQPV